MPKSFFTKEGDEEIANQYLSGYTFEKIANRYGCYKQSVSNSLKRSRTKIRKIWKHASGENNGKWNGGIKIIKGYIHVLKPQHHLARKSDGYVPLHRLVMEEKIGRKILKGEVVNHIDGNPKNNLKENLQLFSNNGEHIKNHMSSFNRDKNGKFIKTI